jgi:threonine synthase
MDISCTVCGRHYPPEGLPYRCEVCGGLYDFQSLPTFNSAQVDLSLPGIWRYRHSFGFAPESDPVSLGEGCTPFVWADVFGRQVAFKCEFLNPSGSFKDRGSAVLVAFLKLRGITEAVEDSSGNAGASLACYSARAGIRTRIFIPETASGPKRRQIETYGAELVVIPGSRTAVSAAVIKEAEAGNAYASHAYLPFNLPGYATTSYEIFEQLGNKMPGALVLPTGQGGFLLGLERGFHALRIANGEKGIFPTIIGVQSRACAPLWAMFASIEDIQEDVKSERKTLAEGVNVRYPTRGDAVIRAVKESGGVICLVDETEILPGRDALAHLGFFVEPTSAIVWSALAQTINELPDPVVVVLTGSGLKYGK